MKRNLIATATVAACALMGVSASADEIVSYNPISAIAGVSYRHSSSPPCSDPVTFDNGFDYFGKQADQHQITAAAVTGPSQAGAALSAPDVAVAFANAEGGGVSCSSSGAASILTGRTTIYDPQGRPLIKLKARFKAAGSSAPPTASSMAATHWQFLVATAIDNEPIFRSNPDGTIVSVAQPIFNTPQNTILSVYGETGEAGANQSEKSVLCDWLGGCVNGDGYTTEFDETIGFEAAPGTLWFQLKTYATDEGFAIVDPVIEPDPVNPDVVVTMEGPRGSAPFNPLAGITADQLSARGIDPGPFIRMGFLDASGSPPPPPPPSPPPPSASDTTPPTTLASATPDANAVGWSKSPVTVTLTATDNVGGSGVKEVHYALAGAATASQVIPSSNASVTISAEGSTTLTYFAVDNAGNKGTEKALTVRIDRTPPTITGLPSNCLLWPPDHRLVQVATINAGDTLSGPAGAPIVTVKSNEPENGTGDGDLAPDVITSDGAVRLRAERDGSGTGRVYTIAATATDLAGNAVMQTAICRVPHDM